MSNENKPVYITNANFNRLVYALTYSYSLNKALSNSEFGLTHILNTMELAHIENYRRMLKEGLLSEHLVKNQDISKVKGKYIEVFTNQKYKPPAMHIDLNCQMILSDYQGISAPLDIVESSYERIAEYLKWIERPEIEQLIDSKKFEEFYDLQNANFKTRGKLVPFTLSNSGVASLFTLKEIRKSIINLLTAAQKYRNSSQEHQNLIKKKGYGTNRNYVRNSDPILEEWHFKYKKELMNLLKSFYRVQTNPTLEFDHELLKKAGFKDCGSCLQGT